MRISFIKAPDTHPLRLLVLRPGGTLEDVQFPNDRLDGAFHLGAFRNGSLIAVGSFYPEKHPALKGWKQFRLRGMATHPQHQGQGAGSQLLAFALDHLRNQAVDLLWCNARLGAVPFYERHGLATLGERFEIPGIGPHYVMWRRV